MMERKTTVTLTPEVKELHDTISILSGEVARLTDDRDNLNTQIKSHQANLQEYIKNQVLFNELLKDIDVKKSIIVDITEDMNTISNAVFLKKQEYDAINVSIEEKRTLLDEVSKLKNDFKILQKNMEIFHDEFSEKKKNAKKDIDVFINKLKDIYESIGTIINNT